MSSTLRAYIREVLTGFGNKEFGKDGVAGNLYPTGTSTGDAGVRPTAHSNVLDDEAAEEQKEEQSTKQAACCLIMTDDGLVLAVSRKDDPSAWGTPGGKVDPGETPEQAAARELTEETGLVAVKLTPVFSKADEHGFVTTTFACEVTGEINTPESGVIRWVHPNVLVSSETSPFADYNRAMFEELGMPID